MSCNHHIFSAINKSAISYKRGFTLVELIVVVAIVGILGSIAVPSFNSSLASMRAKNVASSIHDGLTRARSEAVKRNTSVTLAPADSWDKGWKIYASSDDGNVFENSSITGDVSVEGPGEVEYKPTGRVTGSAEFNIEASMGSATVSRCVTVSLSGMPKIKSSSC